MAKVTGPLLSLSASGTIADAITYVCGHFARKGEAKERKQPEQLFEQGQNFGAGVNVWNPMTYEQKESWRQFTKVFRSAPECASLGFYLTGYNLFMSYYLRFGENGWTNYPAAPV